MAVVFSSDGFPEFFQRVAPVVLRDPLAAFLGGAKDGVMTYRYADAVRLAGHSCPTVAAAWLMTVTGLRALYGSEMPERGGVEVLMAQERGEGTTGVIASVATLLTGAAPETGFGGIGPGGRFARRNLLGFNGNFSGMDGGLLALRRRDNGAAVQVFCDPSVVPFAPEMASLMPKAVGGTADAQELVRFAELWQQRVERMLTEHADDPGLVRADPWNWG